MARALYRSKQVLNALRPRIDAADLELAREQLSSPLQDLFFAMEKRDQRHALAVARYLQTRNVNDPDLLTAALLHDCGKGAVPVWLRIAWVLAPGAVRSMASEKSRGWRGSAYRLVNHPALGAAKAEAAGASQTVLRLVQGRPVPDEGWKLALLQAADDAS